MDIHDETNSRFSPIANAAKLRGIILSFYHSSSWHGAVLATRINVRAMGISYVHSLLFLYSENISQILMNFDMGKYNKNHVEIFIFFSCELGITLHLNFCPKLSEAVVATFTFICVI
jgi:hypothetical protein